MTVLESYIFVMAEEISVVLTTGGILFSLFVGLFAISTMLEWVVSEKKVFKIPAIILSIVFMISVVVAIAGALMPSTKQLAAIYGIPKIVNSEWVTETVPKDAADIYGLAKEWLIETMKEEKGKE